MNVGVSRARSRYSARYEKTENDRPFQVFNRDEPERDKVVHVTVKAADNGRPQLADVCTLAVRVKDINDNTPVFDKSNYNVRVAQVK